MLLKKLLQTKIFISQNNMTMLLKKEGLGVSGIDKYFEVLLINQMIIKHNVLDMDLYNAKELGYMNIVVVWYSFKCFTL